MTRAADTSGEPPLERLAGLLRAEGGLLAETVGPPAGELTAGALPIADPELALAVEAIREGYLVHHGVPRLVSFAGDVDLALLAGDRLYALGLEGLAAQGDLHAIATLAEVIAEGAMAHAEQDPGRAEAAWAQGARAVARQVAEP